MNKDIKRLDLNTPDGAQLNMDALYQIAPSVFTESRDVRGGGENAPLILTPCASFWATMQ